MARTEIEIKLEQNPLNNHRFQYRIKDNGNDIQYTSMNNDTSDIMEKRFIKKGTTNVGRFSSSDRNFIIDSFNIDAGFDGSVIDMVYIPSKFGTSQFIFTADNGYETADNSDPTTDTWLYNDNIYNLHPFDTGHPELIAVIGDFNNYTYADNTTVNTGRICLINYTKMVLDGEVEFYYTSGDIIPPSAVLKTIDYDRSKGELAIGGNFNNINIGGNINVSNLLFFDVKNKTFDLAKTQKVYNNGGFDGVITCVKYGDNNTLYVGGSFGNHYNTGEGYMAKLNTLGNLDIQFLNNLNIDGYVTRFDIDNNGDIYIVGNFSVVNNRDRYNIVKITPDGLANNNFNTNLSEGFDAVPSDIVVYQRNIGQAMKSYLFVGGDFTTYNNTPVGNIIRINPVGHGSVLSFDVSNLDIKVNRLHINNLYTASLYMPIPHYNNLYVSGGYSNNNDIGALLINQSSGNVIEEFYYNDEVNVIITPYLDEMTTVQQFGVEYKAPILFGGKFTQYDNTNQTLIDNDVEVGSNINTTLSNLYNEILYFNNNNNSDYSMNINNNTVLHNYIYINNNYVVVTNIQDEDNYIKITVRLYDDDGSEIIDEELISKMRPLLLRSDFVIKHDIGTFESTKYSVKVYDNNYYDGGIFLQETEVIKDKLSDNQNKTWLNIPPLINRKSLYIDDIINEYIDVNTNRVKSCNQGMYTLLTARNTNNDDNGNPFSMIHYSDISSKHYSDIPSNEVVYVLDGYRESNLELTEFPQVLMKGDYREVTLDDYIVIPYNASKVSGITVRNMAGNIVDMIDLSNESGYVDNVMNKSGFLMYFIYRPGDYVGNRHRLTFFGRGETIIDIRKRNPACLTPTTKVIFRNKWGLLEHTQLIGIENYKLKVDKKEYRKSIRDIDGNINIDEHSLVDYNKNGEVEYRYGTGVIDEKLNDLYDDLVLSESIWLYDNNDLLPVVINETNYNEKKVWVDDVVEYEFSFKEANYKIKNNI